MRILADECVSRGIVEHLRSAGHDVVWVPDTHPGEADGAVLRWSVAQLRILLTADWGFGERAVRDGEPAIGIVIFAMSEFVDNPAEVATELARTVAVLDQALLGKLTIIQAGRVRQRDLASSDRR